MTTRQRGPRERMVSSAAHLIRRDGVTATSMRDVVAHADAPRGSLQHYFPRGKEQLVAEAVDWAARSASRRIDRLLATLRDPSPSRLFAAMVRQWADDLVANEFAAGCTLAAVTIDRDESAAAARDAVAAGFTAWRRPIGRALVGMGVPVRKAPALATLMISAVEGAIVLARAQRDVTPLRTVARELGPLLDSHVEARGDH